MKALISRSLADTRSHSSVPGFELMFAVVPGCGCLPVPKILILPCLPSYLLKPLWFMNSQMRPIQV
jgi:hypothetical protein